MERGEWPRRKDNLGSMVLVFSIKIMLEDFGRDINTVVLGHGKLIGITFVRASLDLK